MPAQLLQILECEEDIEPAKSDKLNMNIFIHVHFLFAVNLDKPQLLNKSTLFWRTVVCVIERVKAINLSTWSQYKCNGKWTTTFVTYFYACSAQQLNFRTMDTKRNGKVREIRAWKAIFDSKIFTKTHDCVKIVLNHCHTASSCVTTRAMYKTFLLNWLFMKCFCEAALWCFHYQR